MSASYRSNHADVLAAWEDSDHRYKAAHEAVGAFAKKYGGDALVFTGRGYDLAALRGSVPPKGGEALWRFDRKAHGWVPRRSTKEGKALAKEFDACRAGRLGEVPGLPHYVQVKGGPHPFQMQGAAMFRHDGYVWACFQAVDPEDVIASGWGTLDESMWEQIKRSEFELAKEASEAVHA